ncbi:MAG TPA: radical SAM protein [Bacteroidetes bacterium]|nr:radical SAM protein [Bacteroidota bacterium]
MNKTVRGRGATINSENPFSLHDYATEHIEGLDEEFILDEKTQYLLEFPKKVVNKVDSPDIGMFYSLNPYQGCEHGCIYCYARNTHHYWGLSAGLDFEQKILVKPDAPRLLKEMISKKNWEVQPISLSGNTDCYQPAERKFRITRQLLEVLNQYRHPLGIITKNQLVLRDIDLLKELAADNLVMVMISITSLDENMRRKLEPRTASALRRLNVIETLAKNNIPCGVMTAPIIPGINSHEIPELMKSAASAGAVTAGFTIVRLNGAVGEIFTKWIQQTFPERAEKVLHMIEETHGGKLNDSRFGTRMKGEGKIAESIRLLWKQSQKKYFSDKKKFEYNLSAFRRPGQMSLF